MRTRDGLGLALCLLVLALLLAGCTDRITYDASQEDTGARSTRQNTGGG
mgnify:CR=1 FL=1